MGPYIEQIAYAKPLDALFGMGSDGGVVMSKDYGRWISVNSFEYQYTSTEVITASTISWIPETVHFLIYFA